MYAFFERHAGPRWAFVLTLACYIILTLLVVLTFAGKAAEFRYGNL